MASTRPSAIKPRRAITQSNMLLSLEPAAVTPNAAMGVTVQPEERMIDWRSLPRGDLFAEKSPAKYMIDRFNEEAIDPVLTRVISLPTAQIGLFPYVDDAHAPWDDWELNTGNVTDDFQPVDSPFWDKLTQAASLLRWGTRPVAFPTETVYGLGANATRSAAVQGIYLAKRRPLDNPLIVHVCSLGQLRNLLRPETCEDVDSCSRCPAVERAALDGQMREDPIPAIYMPLIKRFWPGPLTIILENPPGSILAEEVTAGLSTFGVRMPRSLLALALIREAGVPLAAPSANASTRPSPTTAAHVKEDLDGRIPLIVDGGPCAVGVESTIVDGLSSPPVILRPGGISIEQIRECHGWSGVTIGYRDDAEKGSRPRAPGMKYKHYSPKARVVLYESGTEVPDISKLIESGDKTGTVGLIRTVNWPSSLGHVGHVDHDRRHTNGDSVLPTLRTDKEPQNIDHIPTATRTTISNPSGECDTLTIWEIALGDEVRNVARGLFGALRELDSKGVDTILVEGVPDERDVAAAIMNRLRKAATVRVERPGWQSSTLPS